MSEKTKSSWLFWGTTILVVMLVGYPLSVGPAFGLVSSSMFKSWATARGPSADQEVESVLNTVYWPLGLVAEAFPGSLGALLESYIDFWNSDVYRVAPVPVSAPIPEPPLPPAPTAEASGEHVNR